jgi:dienelactone hydrolase
MKNKETVLPVKALLVFCICVFVCLLCTGLASLVEGGFGSVSVESGFFMPQTSDAANGVPVRIAYKLYRPKEADAAHPAPAVLMMHGYQNDKETSAAYGIELARRGIVVLSVDLYGHGDTTPSMRGRGAGRYKLTDLDTPLSGPKRYLVLLTFSVLDFFRPEISSGLADSSMGGKSAYRYLSSLPFVDADRIGISGHSMGTWASWSVSAAFPGHRAIVLQCGETIPPEFYDSASIKFNNVLLLQALYDEFDMFRDFQNNVRGLEKTPRRYSDFAGQNAPVDWNKTYGAFADGSARRMELIQTNHRLTTHSNHALSAAIDWFGTALNVRTDLASGSHIFMIKETLVLIAMLAALASMLPLFLVLCRIKFFAPLSRPLSGDAKMLSPKSRRSAVILAILISGLTFPFLCQLGHGLIPVPENIFRMTVGNGFITWLTFLMLVSLTILLVWYRRGKGREEGWTLYDLGLAGKAETGETAAAQYRPRQLIPRGILMAFILTGVMYILVCVSEGLFQLDFRFIWPFFRPFSALRFGQFFVYLPFYASFFTVNVGARLYGQLKLPEYSSPALTQLVWWGYSVLVMLGGVFLVALVEYIPFFLGIGPGVDVFIAPLFGGPFMSVMILLIPQFALFFFLSTWLYSKSGTIYTGSFVLAILASWVMSGGSAIF